MNYLKGNVTHDVHDRVCVDILLNSKPKLPDLPYFPDELKFKLNVYDWRKYEGTVGYCTGDDAVSLSVFTQGIWEGSETRLILQLLREGDKGNKVLDFGAHVGWYSVIAGVEGYDVIAYEFDAENVELIGLNAKLNDCSDKISIEHSWVDSNSKVIDGSWDVEIMKCDLEGLDEYAVAMCSKLFNEQRVRYALIEISPIFNDSYPSLIESICSCGYKVYKVPSKGFKYLDEYSVDPLSIVKEYYEVTGCEGVRQENYLFVRID